MTDTPNPHPISDGWLMDESITFHPKAPTRTELDELLGAAREADAITALDEQTVLNAQRDAGSAASEGREVRHLSARLDQTLVGYAQVAGRSAELVVHPDWRGKGIGSILLNWATSEPSLDQSNQIAVWAHGNLPAAKALAERAGLEPVRTLYRLGYDVEPSRPTDPATAVDQPESSGPPPEPTAPDGVDLHPITSDDDAAAWLALNAEAFADHPEQGGLSEDDLAERQAESWFEPEYFLLARDQSGQSVGAGDPIASLWLKAEPGSRSLELYVLAVSPRAQGRGLGRWLTEVALHQARIDGFAQMDLYVDGENEAAVRLYRSAGFVTLEEHVQYR